MKLRKLTTAASVLLVLLAASCSKAPNEKNSSGPKAGEAGPPEAAIRDFLQAKDLKGATISTLEIDPRRSSQSETFEIQFKAESIAQEDLVSAADPRPILKRYGIPSWQSVKERPDLYEVTNPKGTKYVNYGSLLAEWQIDRWKFTTTSFEGSRPMGKPVSELKGNSLVIGTPEVEEFFEKVSRAQPPEK